MAEVGRTREGASQGCGKASIRKRNDSSPGPATSWPAPVKPPRRNGPWSSSTSTMPYSSSVSGRMGRLRPIRRIRGDGEFLDSSRLGVPGIQRQLLLDLRSVVSDTTNSEPRARTLRLPRHPDPRQHSPLRPVRRERDLEHVVTGSQSRERRICCQPALPIRIRLFADLHRDLEWLGVPVQ